MDRSGIVFLGSGPEIFVALKEIYSEGLVKGFGTHITNKRGAYDTINFCTQRSIPIINSVEEAINLQPKFIFMISYPALIKEFYLDRCDFVNLHSALLPKYRGIHGGTWAMINGESKQGYTIHKVDSGIDSGPIYYQKYFDIDINENINYVRNLVKEDIMHNIKKILLSIYNNKLKSYEQNHNESIYVCRRTQDDSLIDWTDTAFNIHNKIRALAPPYTMGAYTFYKGTKFYITKSHFFKSTNYISKSGQIVNIDENGFYVKCGDATLLIKEVFFENQLKKANLVFDKVGNKFDNI